MVESQGRSGKGESGLPVPSTGDQGVSRRGYVVCGGDVHGYWVGCAESPEHAKRLAGGSKITYSYVVPIGAPGSTHAHHDSDECIPATYARGSNAELQLMAYLQLAYGNIRKWPRL